MISLISQATTVSGSVPVRNLCKALSISRSSYYRQCAGRPDPDLELRDQIHTLAIEWPCYGYRLAPYARRQSAILAAARLRIYNGLYA